MTTTRLAAPLCAFCKFPCLAGMVRLLPLAVGSREGWAWCGFCSGGSAHQARLQEAAHSKYIDTEGEGK